MAQSRGVPQGGHWAATKESGPGSGPGPKGTLKGDSGGTEETTIQRDLGITAVAMV